MSQTNWAPLIAGQVGVVPLSLGIPGVAKTAFFEALAQTTGRRFIPYMLDQSLPEELPFRLFEIIITPSGTEIKEVGL